MSKQSGRPLLDFVGIEPVVVRAIPIAQHLAEKIHADTKPYGTYGSTRVKNLVDMVLLKVTLNPISGAAGLAKFRQNHSSPLGAFAHAKTTYRRTDRPGLPPS